MGVGPQPGRVQPRSVLLRHGGSLVFLSLTWHIPSVAAAMMVGAVHLSLADVYYRAMLAGRGGAVGLVAAGALFTLGRWGHGKLREWAALHTGGGGGDGAGGAGAPPFRPGGSPPGSFRGPAAGVSPGGGDQRGWSGSCPRHRSANPCSPEVAHRQ